MKQPAGTLLVTIVQSSLHWENPAANLKMLEEKIRAVTGKMEVVVLPEMFNTGFTMNAGPLAEKMDGVTVEWMRRLSTSLRIILTGSIIIKEEEKYFNRLIWMLPGGEYGFYDKRHLFGYAQEDHYFQAGSKRLITAVKGWKLNMQICYDLRFPVWARQTMPLKGVPDLEEIAPEYDVLVYVANWPEKRRHAWITLLQARAIENQCYVVAVNRTGYDGNTIYYSGDSMIVDPLGTILYSAENREELFTVALPTNKLSETRNNLPFLKDGDPFLIGNQ